MTKKSRLTKLEKAATARPPVKIRVIEIHKAYEDGHTEIEVLKVEGKHDTQKPIEKT
jgi:hypothetical protein